ncbi:hypothetical protein GGQ84_003045 [Desulfitispora alkaliphila]|uniref:M48 family metallopeptidase n=1 Tax=Desulfitispora alkaliphila TaxID=622674 RepID=UPI003D256722
MEKHTVSYKDRAIEFELHRKKVKNINLRVKPDMTVMISANNKVPIKYLKDFVKSRAPWILKHLDSFKDKQAYQKTRDYVSGETIKYLGKQYQLKVIATQAIETVECQLGFINLYVKDSVSQSRKEKLIQEWFKQRAEVEFHQSLERVYPLLENYRIPKPEIIIKTMKSRWGSCNSHKKRITLNSKLISGPSCCIDYVVLHELIHFIQGNHDQDFYKLMTVFMPDWRERKIILEEEVAREL